MEYSSWWVCFLVKSLLRISGPLWLFAHSVNQDKTHYLLLSILVVKDSAQLVNVYHPSLWGNRIYPCCGSSQRSTSKATNGCRSVTWSPNSLQHMGINFSHIIHHPSPSPSPVAKPANGAEVETMVKPVLEGHPAIVNDIPASPSTSHNAIVASGTGKLRTPTASLLILPLHQSIKLHNDFISAELERDIKFIELSHQSWSKEGGNCASNDIRLHILDKLENCPFGLDGQSMKFFIHLPTAAKINDTKWNKETLLCFINRKRWFWRKKLVYILGWKYSWNFPVVFENLWDLRLVVEYEREPRKCSYFFPGDFSSIPSAVWSSLLAGSMGWALTASHKSPVFFFLPNWREGRWEERTTFHLVQEFQQRRAKEFSQRKCERDVKANGASLVFRVLN